VLKGIAARPPRKRVVEALPAGTASDNSDGSIVMLSEKQCFLQSEI
jgi:hypothetical protein